MPKEKLPKKEVISRIKAEMIALREEIKTDVLGPVVASFGFIIALVWRDAIRSIINEFLVNSGLAQKAWVYDVISAVIVTIVVIAIMITITKLGRKKKQKQLKRKIKRIEDKLKE